MSFAACLSSLALAAGLAGPLGDLDRVSPAVTREAGQTAPAPPAPPSPPAPRSPRARAPEPTPAAPGGQAPVQARPGGPEQETPRTDQTIDVAKGTRLVLTNQAGEVTVRAWDRDAVRVQASHSTRERVDVQSADNTLRVRARSARGPAGLVDFTLTVPRWMPVNLSGTYLVATIEGTSAEVNVETVGGDLTLKGGSGAVSLRSIEGEIRVDGASGKLQTTTVNDSITLTNVSGDVVADTTNGDITIASSRAASLEISTVNGDVRFEGPTAEKGTYRITTHNGDVRVSLGPQANATVFVRTFGGDFSSDFPITLPDGMNTRGSKRFNFTLGSGSARVEIESFQGDIRVMKGPLDRPEERRRRRGAAVAPLPDANPSSMADWVERTIERSLDDALAPAHESSIERTIEAALEQAFDGLDREWGGRLAPPAPPSPPTPPSPPAPPRPRRD